MFNQEIFDEFKKTYNQEKIHGDEHVFVFNGHQVLVAYAKYLILYINTKIQ